MTAPAPRPPAPVPIRKNIPYELGGILLPDGSLYDKGPRQWVVWRYEWVNSRWTKVPYSATGGRNGHGGKASTTNPDHWMYLDQAMGYYTHACMDGVGYVFNPPTPAETAARAKKTRSVAPRYVGVDLDHCRNPETGEIQPWAADIIIRLFSYTEVSVSGTGVHIIVEGTLPPGGRKKDRGDGTAIEMYESGRYFTMTGIPTRDGSASDITRFNDPVYLRECSLAGTGGIQHRSDKLAELHREIFGEAQPSGPSLEETTCDASDDEILQRIRKAKNGAKFEALWENTDETDDISSADASFAETLLFYCQGDVDRADRLGRQSRRVRDKWDTMRGEVTWWRYTLEHINAKMDAYYTPPGPYLDVAEFRQAQAEQAAEIRDLPPGADCVELREHIAELNRELNRLRLVEQEAERLETLYIEAKKEITCLRQALQMGHRGALAVAMADEIANQERKGAMPGAQVEIPKGWLVKRSGVSDAQLTDYLKEMSTAGLIEREVVRKIEPVVNPSTGATTYRARTHSIVTMPVETIIDQATGEVLGERIPHRLDLMKRFVSWKSEKAAAHGGVRVPRYCPDHPNATVDVHSTMTCSVCHTPLGTIDKTVKHEHVDEFPATNLDYTAPQAAPTVPQTDFAAYYAAGRPFGPTVEGFERWQKEQEFPIGHLASSGGEAPSCGYGVRQDALSGNEDLGADLTPPVDAPTGHLATSPFDSLEGWPDPEPPPSPWEEMAFAWGAS